MLERYFDRAARCADLWRRYRAMKAAAALRETLWSMVSGDPFRPGVRFRRLYGSNLATYRAAYDAFKQS